MAKPLVYVVDDNVSARSSVCALLATFDYEVRAFDSAESFLAADDKTEPACLLCDVRLPGMSGVQLHRTLKLRGIGLPVILISGYLDSDMVAEALKNGAIAVLGKPIDTHELLEHVETAIQISKHD